MDYLVIISGYVILSTLFAVFIYWILDKQFKERKELYNRIQGYIYPSDEELAKLNEFYNELQKAIDKAEENLELTPQGYYLDKATNKLYQDYATWYDWFIYNWEKERNGGSNNAI